MVRYILRRFCLLFITNLLVLAGCYVVTLASSQPTVAPALSFPCSGNETSSVSALLPATPLPVATAPVEAVYLMNFGGSPDKSPLNQPRGIAVGARGKVYVVDTFYCTDWRQYGAQCW